MRHTDTDPGQKVQLTPDDSTLEARESEPSMKERWGAGEASWQDIKGRFVDDPEGAVAAAEELVRQAVEDRIRRLTQELEELRGNEPGEGASQTEGLRRRLIRYQAYFEAISGTTAH